MFFKATHSNGNKQDGTRKRLQGLWVLTLMGAAQGSVLINNFLTVIRNVFM